MSHVEPVPVVCLVLRDGCGRVLATQRGSRQRLGGLWEFPGGKLEAGEAGEAALRREIEEELGISLGALVPLPHCEHRYDFGWIRLFPYLARCEEHPVLTLSEHSAACWIRIPDWSALPWAPADLPVIHHLLEQGFPE